MGCLRVKEGEVEMAVYGIRNKYSDTDCATIQIRKLKDKDRQQERANDIIPVLIKDGSIPYSDDYYAHLLWEE